MCPFPTKKPERNECLAKHLAWKTKVNRSLSELQVKTERLLDDYCQYAGVTIEDLGDAFQVSAEGEDTIVLVPVSAFKSKLISAETFRCAAMLLVFVRSYLFERECMKIDSILEWSVHYGILKGLMLSATSVAKAASPGGKVRAEGYEMEKVKVIAKCNDMFPDWISSKKPAADKMAEELIGMISLSHRMISSVISNESPRLF